MTLTIKVCAALFPLICQMPGESCRWWWCDDVCHNATHPIDLYFAILAIITRWHNPLFIATWEREWCRTCTVHHRYVLTGAVVLGGFENKIKHTTTITTATTKWLCHFVTNQPLSPSRRWYPISVQLHRLIRRSRSLSITFPPLSP